MPDFTRISTTDEDTGLPPLDVIQDDDNSILVLRGATTEGLVMLPTLGDTSIEPIDVIYLHLRGVMSDSPDGRIDFSQVHVAIPKDIWPFIVEQVRQVMEGG